MAVRLHGRRRLFEEQATGTRYGQPISQAPTKPGQYQTCTHTRPNEQLVAEAVALACRSDVVVAALVSWNKQTWNSEGVSRSDITLGLPQVELLKALKATGKPVILIFDRQ